MSRELNPSQVWSQVPVANRLIEVNTKTGFSLTAGSYSVRASSSQRGSITLSSVATNTATISSVTLTRAHLSGGGYNGDATAAAGTTDWPTSVRLSSATDVTAARGNSASGIATTGRFDVLELF